VENIYVIHFHHVWKNLWSLYESYYRFWWVLHVVNTSTLMNIKIPLISQFTQLLWLWWYGSWIYNYLCNKCLSPLKLCIWTTFMARCTRYMYSCTVVHVFQTQLWQSKHVIKHNMFHGSNLSNIGKELDRCLFRLSSLCLKQVQRKSLKGIWRKKLIWSCKRTAP